MLNYRQKRLFSHPINVFVVRLASAGDFGFWYGICGLVASYGEAGASKELAKAVV
jgi:hypothetical protein